MDFDMPLNPKTPKTFQEHVLPEHLRLAGYAVLVHALALKTPVHRPSCVSEKHIRGSQRAEPPWIVFDRRYWPGDTFGDHLSFALHHERMDLLILKRISYGQPPTESQTGVAGS